MFVGGTLNAGFNAKEGDGFYEFGQNFVGGALSTYVGMGKAVPGKFSLFQGQEFAGKSQFKMEKSNFINKTLKVHGDKFISKGLQNSAFDFAYTPEDEFRKRQGGHAELFAWGGLMGSIQSRAFDLRVSNFQTSLFMPVIEWYGNGFIKKRYKSVKRNKSQMNKGIVGFYKWFGNVRGL